MEDFLWLHMKFTDIFLKPLIQQRYPFCCLLCFYFLFWLDLLEYLNDKKWIEESLFDVFADITFFGH